jgi:hypothetical protein
MEVFLEGSHSSSSFLLSQWGIHFSHNSSMFLLSQWGIHFSHNSSIFLLSQWEIHFSQNSVLLSQQKVQCSSSSSNFLLLIIISQWAIQCSLLHVLETQHRFNHRPWGTQHSQM